MKRVIDLIKVRQPTLNEPLISLTYNRSRLSFFVSHNYNNNNKNPQKSSNAFRIIYSTNFSFIHHSCIPNRIHMIVSYFNLMNIVFIPLNNIFSWCFLFDRWFLVITFHVWNSFHICMKYGIMNVYVCL